MKLRTELGLALGASLGLGLITLPEHEDNNWLCFKDNGEYMIQNSRTGEMAENVTVSGLRDIRLLTCAGVTPSGEEVVTSLSAYEPVT